MLLQIYLYVETTLTFCILWSQNIPEKICKLAVVHYLWLGWVEDLDLFFQTNFLTTFACLGDTLDLEHREQGCSIKNNYSNLPLLSGIWLITRFMNMDQGVGVSNLWMKSQAGGGGEIIFMMNFAIPLQQVINNAQSLMLVLGFWLYAWRKYGWCAQSWIKVFSLYK